MTPEESMAWLDNMGIKYEVCNTPVPVLANKVNCGQPLGMGDLMIDEYNLLPQSAVRLHPVIDVPARGDSMIEADIHENDRLGLQLGVIPQDGDIVMAGIGGDFTAKVFFVDSQGRKWLLPKNKDYDPILLTDDCDVRISGVVSHIMKKAARFSHNDCMSILNRFQAKQQQQGDTFQRLARAVADGRLLFWAAAAWAVAYAVVRDCHSYEGSVIDFERKAATLQLPSGFEYPCAEGKVQRTISNHPYMRLHIDKWRAAGASPREVVLMEFLRKNL